MGLDRDRGVALLRAYFPAKGTFGQGTIGFDHIAKDYTNSGTTCGYPTHWMLWRLGCSEKSLVNRYEPDTDFTYTDSANLSKIFHSHAFVNLLTNQSAREQFLSGAIYPKPGDTIFISTGEVMVDVTTTNKDGVKETHQEKRWKEHVYQVLGGKTGSAKGKMTWEVANSGQGEQGKQNAQILDARGVEKRGDAWYDTKDSRQFYGWLDIDKLSAGNAPNVPKDDPLAMHSSDSSAGPPKQDSVIGVWKLDNGQCYMFYKGHRVFRLASSNLQMITEAGFWFPMYGELRVKWPSKMALEVMKINGNFASVQTDLLTHKAVKTLTTGVVMNTFQENRGSGVSDKAQQTTMAGRG